VPESLLREKSLLNALVCGVALSDVTIANPTTSVRARLSLFIFTTPSLKENWLLGMGELEAEEEGQLEVVHQLWMWL